jgi:hypothetical protein
MSTINTAKELSEADSPILLFECFVPGGVGYQRFSTHALNFNGEQYTARVLNHNLFDFQLSADDAMDSVAQVSLTLANADSLLSEIEAAAGWKGTQLTVYFAFADLTAGTITTESTIVFRGVAGDPDVITEDALQLTFTNKLSLLRVGLPATRIQRLCPWAFPGTADQRSEALNGSRFSRFHACGYSADVPGGFGNLNNGEAFTTCDHTKDACIARGMFDHDTRGNATARFGGLEFVPSSVLVRGFGEKTTSVSRVQENVAKYNDFIPMVYGTGWLSAPVIFARNDGNLTHMEALLGTGPIDQVLKVVVSGIEIPKGIAGADMTATGWYNIVSNGDVQGAFNLDFTDANHQPLGDSHGSMAVLSVVVPNRINSGGSLPHVEVLLQGLRLDRFALDGSFLDNTFTNNPAWVILDILRRAGWSLSDLHISQFAKTANYCDELISTHDLNGNAIHVPRYHSNLILTKRKSAAEIVRGVRVACGLMLRYGINGLLELLPEAALAVQHNSLPGGSNASEPLSDGWPAYEFGDGTSGTSGIARDPSGRSTVRLASKSLAELSNRLNVEFQDEANEYQQDSLSVVSDDDQALIGYEMGSTSTALGIPNFNQAFRILSRQLAKLTAGNRYVEFETSFRALTLRPGDIITLTYLKEGFVRVPFRVIKLTPALNFRRIQILAQVHDDAWYSDDPGTGGGTGRQPGAGISLPRPLLGTALGNSGRTEFGIAEQGAMRTDGSASATLRVSFAEPSKPALNGPNLPLLSFAPQLSSVGGSLPGGTNYYYAVSATDVAGNEGMLSFVVTAAIPQGTATNTVTLSKLSFPPTAAAFNVYRGQNPQLLYRIASAQALAPTFTDSGLNVQPAGPPDPNFDHATFYYRLEFAGPIIANIFSPLSIGSADLNATPSVYSGMSVRLIDGTGSGQERRIATNDASTVNVSSPWSVVPDSTTVFVITESAWRFGAVSSTSPVEFEVPNRTGTVVQVTGRAANVRDQEGTSELCPVTRWVVGGGSGSQLDSDIAGPPTYILNVAGGGNLTLSQVGFADLTNTRSVTAGTLQLTYFDELQMPTAYQLPAPIDSNVITFALNSPVPQGTLGLQIGTEIMTFVSFDQNSNTCTVVRGQMSSAAQAHSSTEPVFPLQQKTFVVPFARDFFENPASQNFAHNVHFPDVRVAASQFYVTNSRGNGSASNQLHVLDSDGGLRTCSGGQLAMQVGGYLAIQQNAVPPLLVEAQHAPRDVRASVTEAPQVTPIALQLWQGTTAYTGLTIQPGQTTSEVVDGKTLAALQNGATLRLDVTAVGQSAPGRDLTVTIRL